MVARVAEIVDVQNLGGQEVLNVFHFVDPAGTGDISTLVSDYVAHVIPTTAALQTADLTHVAIRHREVYPTVTLQLTTAISPPVAGTAAAGDTEPSAVAASIQFILGVTVVLQGGFTGHLKRSGCRIGGIGEGAVLGNTMVSGFITAANTWFTAIENPGTDVFQLCVASFLDGARVRHPAVQAYSIITGIGTPGPSTQNSRKVLRGRTR
jgi:hypothetical protein